MQQQQQSNFIVPQLVNGPKKGMTPKKGKKMNKLKGKKMPSYEQVQKSIKKSMGY